MAKCYNCKKEIDSSNRTIEHIILNACGGRLTSSEIICKGCNSKFGVGFDAVLAKQTNDLMNLLLIKRQKGKPQSIKGKLTTTGEDYYIQPDGSPTFSKPKISESTVDDKHSISVTAKNEKEFRETLLGVKKKHPQLDIEECIKSARHSKKYLDAAIQFQSVIGGDDVFKSITKTALNYYMSKGGEDIYIDHLLPYLNGDIILDAVWMHYPGDIISISDQNEVSHIIKLVGNPKERILYAYVELFNVHNFIVKLSDDYKGKNIDETYIFDLINTININEQFDLNYSREELLQFFSNKEAKPFNEIRQRLQRTVGIAMQRQSDNHTGKLISNAFKKSLEKHPEGIPISEEMIDELIHELVNEITPLLLHMQKMEEEKIRKYDRTDI